MMSGGSRPLGVGRRPLELARQWLADADTAMVRAYTQHVPLIVPNTCVGNDHISATQLQQEK